MFAPAADPLVPASVATFEELGVPYRKLDADEAARIFPSLAVADDELVLLEEAAGVVHARRAVRVLVERTVALGGTLVKGRARPAGRGVEVGGRRIGADAVVWACGAWTARLFPQLVDVDVIEQDLFYFEAPPAWKCPPVPAFMDWAAGYSGCGDFAGRGVKVGGDLLGPPLEPDGPPAAHDEAQESAARAYVARRFPALGGSAVVAREICHSALVRRRALEVAEIRGEVPIARHPEDPAIMLVGDGSGHGFKHAPVIATLVESLLG
jgi:glycine/D-amino acid oxidase-like deaminating enzyme